MAEYTEDQLRFHHSRCSRNQEVIQSSKQAGCFHCVKIFPASEVTAFIDHPPSGDAHCPKCGIDSVIADDGRNEFSLSLLNSLQKYCFGGGSAVSLRSSLTTPSDRAQVAKYTEQMDALVRKFQQEK